MKKLATLLLLGGLMFGFCGCSGSDSTSKAPEEKKEAPGTPKDGV